MVLISGLLGEEVVALTDTSLLILSSPIPLHRSVVHMQAEMESDSIDDGEHWSPGSMGSSMLPSKMLVGKHSLMTDTSLADFLQE